MIFTECDTLPITPVTVKLYEPAGVECDVEILSVEDPEPLIELGVKVAVAPLGRDEILNGMLPGNPLGAVTLTV